MTHYLIIDVSNILYRTFFANKEYDETTGAGMAFHSALLTLNAWFQKVKPHKMVMAFDRPSWRKAYTADDMCVSKKPYKGNRRQNMTPSEKAKYTAFMNHMQEFELLMQNHTTILCLAGEGLEADDLIAGFVQKYTDDQHTILSSDKDLIQLLGYSNVDLKDPAKGDSRTLEEWEGDAEYFLFEKCIRGDAQDNVQSAFPRVRSTKIKQAYTDPFFQVNMMNEKWTDAHGIEHTVKNLFEENRLLMDLAAQPECVRRLIDETIEVAEKTNSNYSHFHFLRFCGKYELKKVAENAEQFTKLLSR